MMTADKTPLDQNDSNIKAYTANALTVYCGFNSYYLNHFRGIA